jgi:holin-like protein
MPERARTKARRLFGLAMQIAALWLLSVIARYLAAFSPLPLPAGAVGMVLLFALLGSGLLRPRWIEAGADLLIRHLGLFLVPYAVSFIAFAELIAASGAAILAVVVASTAIGIAAAGWAAQAAARLPGMGGTLARSMRQ